MRFFLPLLIFTFFHAPALAGDNWPQFRGPAGDGISDARGVPVTWSESQNIRWKTAIHDKGWSSPVIWGNQVWLTTAREDGTEYFAVAVDRASGKVLHDVHLFSEKSPADIRRYNSYASPTPVIEGGRVYIHFGTYGTACLDTATGKVLWERHDLHCDHWRGPASSPILYGNLLILTFDGHDVQFLAALDKMTGKIAWKKDRHIRYSSDDGDLHKAYSTPSVIHVGGKPQLVSPSAEATIAFDPATGDELWRVYHGGMNASSRPVVLRDLVFLTTGSSKNLLAVRLGHSGELGKEAIAWRVNRSVPTRPSVIAVDGLLYMVNDQGVASCLDPKTGKSLWEERIGGAFAASPVYAAGRIYVPDEDSKTHVFAAGRTFQSLAVNKLDAGCMASPAIAGDSIFLRTKTHLYCIGP
jgi:outer membrane protein assembly factor BamB